MSTPLDSSCRVVWIWYLLSEFDSHIYTLVTANHTLISSGEEWRAWTLDFSQPEGPVETFRLPRSRRTRNLFSSYLVFVVIVASVRALFLNGFQNEKALFMGHKSVSRPIRIENSNNVSGLADFFPLKLSAKGKLACSTERLQRSASRSPERI